MCRPRERRCNSSCWRISAQRRPRHEIHLRPRRGVLVGNSGEDVPDGGGRVGLEVRGIQRVGSVGSDVTGGGRCHRLALGVAAKQIQCVFPYTDKRRNIRRADEAALRGAGAGISCAFIDEFALLSLSQGDFESVRVDFDLGFRNLEGSCLGIDKVELGERFELEVAGTSGGKVEERPDCGE